MMQNNQQHSINDVNAKWSSLNSTTQENKRKQSVCVHWMKDACKKGGKCEFLHVFDEDKLPVCKFFQQTQHCQKGEQCPYKHPKPDEMPLLNGSKKK
jgi:hypothetical protein